MNEKTGNVGAFWVIAGPRVIGEAVKLGAAIEVNETRNGALGHDELWDSIEKPAGLIGRTYTSIPRGRVIFLASKKLFVVYAANEIARSENARRAVELFYGIESSSYVVQWRFDSHYVTQPELLDENSEFLDEYQEKRQWLFSFH